VLRHAHAHRPDVFTHFIPEWDENIDLALDWLSICGHLLFDLDGEVEEVEGVRCGIGNLGFVLSILRAASEVGVWSLDAGMYCMVRMKAL